MAELTPKERVMRLLRKEPIDTMPFFSGMGMVVMPGIEKSGYKFATVHTAAERMAAAGVKRLGLEDRVSAYLPPDEITPAVAQGAVAVQIRADDDATGNWVRRLDHPPTRAAAAAERALLRRLEGGCQVPVGALATIGSTAPFVGLFGTTFGIINAFQGMALTGSGGIAAVSSGISEALVTTAYGLFVAVPAVWAYNYFSGRVEGFNVEMDNSSSELLDYFIKKSA